MDKKDLLEQIIQDVESVSNVNKIDSIKVENLLKYLKDQKRNLKIDDEIDEKQHQIDLANFDANVKYHLAERDENLTHRIEMFKSVIISGTNALRACMLMNGGATIALLAFIGRIWSDINKHQVALELSNSLGLFAYGVFSAGVASGMTYITQYFYQEDLYTLAVIFHILTVFFSIAFLYLFLNGSITAGAAFKINFANA